MTKETEDTNTSELTSVSWNDPRERLNKEEHSDGVHVAGAIFLCFLVAVVIFCLFYLEL